MVRILLEGVHDISLFIVSFFNLFICRAFQFWESYLGSDITSQSDGLYTLACSTQLLVTSRQCPIQF